MMRKEIKSKQDQHAVESRQLASFHSDMQTKLQSLRKEYKRRNDVKNKRLEETTNKLRKKTMEYVSLILKEESGLMHASSAISYYYNRENPLICEGFNRTAKKERRRSTEAGK